MIDHVAHVRADGARFADVVRGAPLDAAVPACAGWALRDLAHHLGEIHRWARVAAATGERPNDGALEPPPPDDELADWIDAGVTALADTLDALDPTAATWHPFPTPRVAAVWPRRQAHETVVHRWDAESVTDEHTPIDPELAADGIAEYFELIVPRLVARDDVAPPDEPLVIELTDLGVVVEGAAAGVRVVETPESVDVAASAETMLLALWGRVDGPEPSPLARAWLTLGGN